MFEFLDYMLIMDVFIILNSLTNAVSSYRKFFKLLKTLLVMAVRKENAR
jgi:hypothetical protein